MVRIPLLALTIWATLLPAACGGNHGHSGSPLEDVNHDGKIVILAFGDSTTRGVGDGPDVLGGATSQAVNHIQSMIDSVFAAGAVPILGTITPICCDTKSRHPQSVILSYNDELRTLAANNGVLLIDFYSAFSGGAEADYDETRGLIHQPEGLHPTPDGYDLMAETARAIF